MMLSLSNKHQSDAELPVKQINTRMMLIELPIKQINTRMMLIELPVKQINT